MDFRHKPKPPKYTEEGTVEQQILNGAEKYFSERDENLRFGLVKRVFQWMLDTDENGWFERRSMLSSPINFGKEPAIRSSHLEIDDYLGVIGNDIVDGSLTGELSAARGYLSIVSGEIPEQYEKRRNFVADCIIEYEKTVISRLKIRKEIASRPVLLRRSRFKEVQLPPIE